MEFDAIKLAKKLSPYTQITVIAKEGYYIADSKNTFVGINGITLETVSFLFTMSFSILFKIRRIVQEKGIKNVIFFGASELKSLYFAFLGLQINLIVRHGTTKTTPKKDWFHRLIYSDVNYHVAICKHLQNNVDFIIPFGKKTQSKLIYSSVQIDPFEKQESSKLTLLHVGRIDLGKGQADAIKACEILYENGIDFTFYLVGEIDQKYNTTFMELYESLPYRDNIKLVGYSDHLAEYYAKSDVFLFPSYGEGLSNAFLEALGHGLSCICYNNTSFPELKDLGFNFEIVDNKNISELKKSVFNQTSLYRKQGNNHFNQIKIQNEFHPQGEITNYLQILI